MARNNRNSLVFAASISPSGDLPATTEVHCVSGQFYILESDFNVIQGAKNIGDQSLDDLPRLESADEVFDLLRRHLIFSPNASSFVYLNPEYFELADIKKSSIAANSDVSARWLPGEFAKSVRELYIDDTLFDSFSASTSITDLNVVVQYGELGTYHAAGLGLSSGTSALLFEDVYEQTIVCEETILYWSWHGDSEGAPVSYWGGVSVLRVNSELFIEHHFGDDGGDLFSHEMSNESGLIELLVRVLTDRETTRWFDAFINLCKPDFESFMGESYTEDFADWIEPLFLDEPGLTLNLSNNQRLSLIEKLAQEDANFRAIYSSFANPNSAQASRVRQSLSNLADGSESFISVSVDEPVGEP